MAKFEKHISLSIGTSFGLFTLTTTSASYGEAAHPTYAQIDVSKYSGGTYYFEIVMKTSAATAYSELYNKTAGAAVSGSEVTTTSTSNTRLRSSALTLTGSDTYTDRYKNDGSNTTTYYGARVVVEQSANAITSTETQITLFNYTVNTTTSSSYVVPGTIGASHFLYTSANWDGTVAIYFEAIFKTSGGTAGSQLATVAGVAVASSEVTTTSTSYARVRSGAITLSNATAYRAEIKSDSGTTSFISARVVIQQSASPTKSEAHLPASITAQAASATGGSYQDQGGRVYYDPAKWSLTSISWYHEVCYNSNVANGTLRLYDITGSAALSNSNITSTNATERQRSTAVTMPGVASLIREEVDSAAGTVYNSIAHMIAVMTWVNTGGMLLSSEI